MKKFIYLFVIALALASCEKEDPATTYQIKNNMPSATYSDPYLDGSLWEVIVYSYVGTDIAKQDNVEPIDPDGGLSKVIAVTDNIEKVKVSFKFLPQESVSYSNPANSRKYVIAYTYLEKGKNNLIVIDAETMISTFP